MSEQTAEPIDVNQLLAICIDQLAGVAWAKLGLQPDPITGTIAQDLLQARIAVDAVANLAGLLESNLDDGDRRQMQNLVRDLRINYVNRTQGASN